MGESEPLMRPSKYRQTTVFFTVTFDGNFSAITVKAGNAPKNRKYANKTDTFRAFTVNRQTTVKCTVMTAFTVIPSPALYVRPDSDGMAVRNDGRCLNP